MILELASLHIVPGREAGFEAAFAQACRIIAGAPGYLSHQLQRCVEEPGRYLLLVNWRTLEDHTLGFRQVPEHDEWKRLLHPFYQRPPAVEHYAMVASSGGPDDGIAI
ncbi:MULTISPECIES: antibiotic biosynthesis monooxygenase family protein [Polaromonas]|uniref:Antibiotic biosynthesis monooxygenase family protein n=1 Tax=Polaromonas aquatica TaxID=332657 RepID=A0ABW1TVK3_9BURK